MYLFRGRDRRLVSQTARDIALVLQRDYRTFNRVKRTTTLSTYVTVLSGYLYTGANAWPNISWQEGTSVDSAFITLQQLLTQLSKGQYESTGVLGVTNLVIYPVTTITWPWIQSLYAYINPQYAADLAGAGITVPTWPYT